MATPRALPIAPAAGIDDSVPPSESNGRQGFLVDRLSQVRAIARRIHRRVPGHVPLHDLEQEGVLGLMDAVNKYNHARNVRFDCYARFRIRGAILDSLRGLDWGTRQLRRDGRRVEQAARQATARLGRTPCDVELADELSVSLEEFQRLTRDLRGLDIVSITGRQGTSCDAPSIAELHAPSRDDPYEVCLRREVCDLLRNNVGRLSVRERRVLMLYYFEERTMKEVGAALGVGESRVSQIHSAALARLRASLPRGLGHAA